MTGTLLTSALGLVFWIVAANLYDDADFGVATTAVYTMMMLADVAVLGLRSGLVRYLPLVQRTAGRTIVWAYGLAALSAGLAGVGFLVGLDWWAPDLSALTETLLVFGLFAISTACWALFNLQDAVLVAERKAPWVPIENGIFGLAKIALLFPFAELSPELGIFWAWTLPVFPIVIVINLLVARQVGARDRLADPRSDTGPGFGAMLSFSLADWVASIARLATLVAIPLMVLGSEGKVMAGYFNVAWLITFTIFTLSMNAAHALLAENSHERDQERRNTVQAGLLSLGLTLPIVVVGVIAAPFVLLIYGSGFADNASTVLRILLVAAVPNVIHQIYVGRLRSQGRMGAVVWLETLLSAIVVGLTALLLPRYGIDGVGIAWLVGLVLLAGVAVVREWSTLRAGPVGPGPAGNGAVADHSSPDDPGHPGPTSNGSAGGDPAAGATSAERATRP